MKRKRRKLNFFWRIVTGMVALFFVFALVGTGLGFHLYRAYSRELPSDQEIFTWRPPEATRIYDRNGSLLYEIYGKEKRIIVGADQISQHLKNATIAIEDERFYAHKGVDVRGVARALIRNFEAGGTVEGASTITQQLVKNAYLGPERTLNRKAKELLLAIRLEKNYSKDEILALYLNEVGYGSNIYGAEMAAQTYYGKSAKELTLSEAATLAALTKAPGELTPYGGNVRALVARRNMVLEKMQEQGFITAEAATVAKSENIVVRERREHIEAPHFVMYIRQELEKRFGRERVETGGLRVVTSLDMRMQRIAEDVVRESIPDVERRGASNAALVSINPKNGEVLAMVGSRDYFDTARDGNVNVTTSSRPPGSAFKPIAYATAFEKGPWSPGSTLFDVKTNFGDDRFPYEPNNYDGRFHGPVSIRQALANSYNIPAVKILALAGKNDVISKARDLGITTLTRPDAYGLSLVLGGGDVTPLELAGAYGAFANKGEFNAMAPILKVTQGDKVLYEHKAESRRVFAPQVAYQINSILSDAEARVPVFGTRGPLNLPGGRIVAAKTGTTQDYRDAWTVGYTPSLVAAVWVGNNDFSPMKPGSAGAMAAAPIWNAFMTRALEGIPNEQFESPGDLEMLTVDAITGKQPTGTTRQTRQDIFAPWQRPSTVETVSFRIYGCNNEVREVQSARVVRSELPDNLNWEKPVIAWARANGYPTTAGVQDVHETCEPPVELVSSDDQQAAVGGDSQNSTPEPPAAPKPDPTPEPDNHHEEEPEGEDDNDRYDISRCLEGERVDMQCLRETRRR